MAVAARHDEWMGGSESDLQNPHNCRLQANQGMIHTMRTRCPTKHLHIVSGCSKRSFYKSRSGDIKVNLNSSCAAGLGLFWLRHRRYWSNWTHFDGAGRCKSQPFPFSSAVLGTALPLAASSFCCAPSFNNFVAC